MFKRVVTALNLLRRTKAKVTQEVEFSNGAKIFYTNDPEVIKKYNSTSDKIRENTNLNRGNNGKTETSEARRTSSGNNKTTGKTNTASKTKNKTTRKVRK